MISTNFCSQQLPFERENEEKKYLCRVDFSSCFLRVESGLAFILGHFSEPLFPRKVATAATALSKKYQDRVDDKDRAMLYYRAAPLYEDCRINAFGLNQTNPDLIFFDLDTEDFASVRSLNLALTSILKTIEEKIGGHPTVIWSGRGYHIIQPIDCSINLDDVKEFAELTYDVSNKFLQFAERYLSNGKCDSSNNPATRSCLLRIPGSLNSKCKAAGIDAEVKVLREWDGHRPDYRLLMGSFYAHLVGLEAQRQNYRHTTEQRENKSSGIPNDHSIEWIERLLQTPIEDCRQNDAVSLIIAPYLINVKHLDADEAYDIIMEWLDKCEQLRPLSLSRHEVDRRVEQAIYNSQRSGIRNMRISTLKDRNPWLHDKLRLTK
jgi:Primase X